MVLRAPDGCAPCAGLPLPPERERGSEAGLGVMVLHPPDGCAPCAGLPLPPERERGSAVGMGVMVLRPPDGCAPCAGLPLPPERERGSEAGLGVMVLRPPVDCAPSAGLPPPPERERGSAAIMNGVVLLNLPAGCALIGRLPSPYERERGSAAIANSSFDSRMGAPSPRVLEAPASKALVEIWAASVEWTVAVVGAAVAGGTGRPRPLARWSTTRPPWVPTSQIAHCTSSTETEPRAVGHAWKRAVMVVTRRCARADCTTNWRKVIVSSTSLSWRKAWNRSSADVGPFSKS